MRLKLKGLYASDSSSLLCTRVTFVLVPGFSLHAFTAALEPLRLANKVSGKKLFEWTIASKRGEVTRSSSGIEFSNLEDIDDCAGPDWMLICAGEFPKDNIPSSLPHQLREAWRTGLVVGGLCTGAFALAEAGILANAEFTLHWDDRESFQVEYPLLSPSNKLYCVDRRIVSSSGGASSTDLMLSLIARKHGTDLAAEVLDMCLHGKMRGQSEPSRSSISSVVGQRSAPLVRAIQKMEKCFDQELTMEQIAQTAGVSRRQFERLFRVHMQTTPYRYLTEVRLEKARKLLLESEMSTIDVSVACGFGSPSNFSKHFREKYGVTPSKYSAVRMLET